MPSMCIGWKIGENYCGSDIEKVYRINCENSLSNERKNSVLEYKVLTSMYNSILFLSYPPVFIPLLGYSSLPHDKIHHSINWCNLHSVILWHIC